MQHVYHRHNNHYNIIYLQWLYAILVYYHIWHIRTHLNSAIVFNKGNIDMHAHVKIVMCAYFIYITHLNTCCIVFVENIYNPYKHALYNVCAILNNNYNMNVHPYTLSRPFTTYAWHIYTVHAYSTYIFAHTCTLIICVCVCTLHMHAATVL